MRNRRGDHPGSIQPIADRVRPDALVDASSGRPLWTCPRCGHRFVTANTWHSCSRHDVESHFAGRDRRLRLAFDRLVLLYERCGPIVVAAQKTRIVFMVRVRFGGCRVLRDRLIASVSLARRDENPRWLSIDQVAPGWYAHRLEIRTAADLDDAILAELVCESYRDFGQQARLVRARTDR